MKPMNRFALAALALLVTNVAAFAGVMNGGRYTNGDGNTVTVNSRGTTMGTNHVTMSDGYGTSGVAEGTPTNGGCAGETSESADMSTHETDANGDLTGNSNKYRVSGGKAQQQQANGSWKNMKKARGPQPAGSNGDGTCDTVVAPPGPPRTIMSGGDTVGGHPASMHVRM